MEGNDPLSEGIDAHDSTTAVTGLWGQSAVPRRCISLPLCWLWLASLCWPTGKVPCSSVMSSGAIRYSQKRLPQQIKSASLINIFKWLYIFLPHPKNQYYIAIVVQIYTESPHQLELQ